MIRDKGPWTIPGGIGKIFHQTVDNHPERRIFNRMVKSHALLDTVFHALSDPTRRAMLRDLSAGPRTVGELAAPFEISLAGASKHIRMLERAGLVQREVRGRVHTCRLDARPLHAGAEWLRHYERFWNRKLDVLQTILEAEDAAARPAAKKTARKPRPPRSKP